MSSSNRSALILKGSTWYFLGDTRRSAEHSYRLFRLSRIDAVEPRDIRFDRPPGFDLAAAWAQHRQAFLASLPEYLATVRVAPEAEPQLALLDEGAPELPPPTETPRDEHAWARLDLRFERTATGAARHLLRLGADLEVLHPPELRELMARTAAGLAALYDPPDRSV